MHPAKPYRLRNGGIIDAVSDLSFAVAAGECFGLLGPNGAGKSSAIHCISGCCPASQGRVCINGHDVHARPKRARRGLGVCSQEETLDSDFSVFDQPVRHATYFRIPIPTARERATMLLSRFGLSDKAGDPVESLSGGLRRRLQVARTDLRAARAGAGRTDHRARSGCAAHALGGARRGTPAAPRSCSRPTTWTRPSASATGLRFCPRAASSTSTRRNA